MPNSQSQPSSAVDQDQSVSLILHFSGKHENCLATRHYSYVKQGSIVSKVRSAFTIDWSPEL
ncbi:MAG: hypothetical protein JWN34_647 [Bryobacterales bacterium]|nr:hypothetical protein [Bryobacterales bacterium]